MSPEASFEAVFIDLIFDSGRDHVPGHNIIVLFVVKIGRRVVIFLNIGNYSLYRLRFFKAEFLELAVIAFGKSLRDLISKIQYLFFIRGLAITVIIVKRTRPAGRLAA